MQTLHSLLLLFDFHSDRSLPGILDFFSLLDEDEKLVFITAAHTNANVRQESCDAIVERRK